jgi:hypothetical protein
MRVSRTARYKCHGRSLGGSILPSFQILYVFLPVGNRGFVGLCCLPFSARTRRGYARWDLRPQIPVKNGWMLCHAPLCRTAGLVKTVMIFRVSLLSCWSFLPSQTHAQAASGFPDAFSPFPCLIWQRTRPWLRHFWRTRP